jgi:glutathione S-transferase
LNLDFPNLPYLLDGDLKLTQSKAVLYYLGRKYNLMGTTPKEEAHVMMLCEEAHDLRMKSNGVFYTPEGESETARKAFVDTTLAEHLQKFDDYIGKNQTKFLVGNQPTVADFQVFEYIDACLYLDEGNSVLDKYSNVKQFLNTIRELPELKDYIAKELAQVPLNNKGKCYIRLMIQFLEFYVLVAKFGGKVIQRK